VEAVLKRIASGKSPRAIGSAADLDELEAVNRKLTDLAETYARGGITRPEWMRARARTASRRRLLTERVDRPRSTPDAPEIMETDWPTLTLDKQRAVIVRHVARVTVRKVAPGEARSVFNPSRLRIRWR
jgi:hypothetical protein